MVPRWRSSGVATLVAMVSGLAPGICAWTEIVGKSTSGSGETGSSRNAATPASATPAVSKMVATGRVMKGVEKLMARQNPASGRRWSAAGRRAAGGRARRRQGRSPAW